MSLESLPGAKSSGEARKSSELKMMHQEDRLEFAELRKEFRQQAVHVFKTNQDFMKKLRSSGEFQHAKQFGDYDSEDKFTTLAKSFSEYMDENLSLEDERQQAALLALLARLDQMQDDDMRKQAALKRAA